MSEQTANPEITENPNGENEENVTPEVPETPEDTYTLPSISEIDFSEPVVTTMAQQILIQYNQIREIDAVLDRQKSDFAETKLIDYAKDSDDSDIKAIYAQYENQVKRLKKITADMLNKVSEKLGGEKLSEDDIKAKQDERKTAADTTKLSLELINRLIDQGMAGEKTEDAKQFVAHISVPGMRTSKGSGSSGTSAPKPRLNNGSVSVKDQNHAAFPMAAKHLSSILNHEVTTSDLVNAWISSQNVSDWKDIPNGLSSFTFEGTPITVLKNPKK